MFANIYNTKIVKRWLFYRQLFFCPELRFSDRIRSYPPLYFAKKNQDSMKMNIILDLFSSTTFVKCICIFPCNVSRIFAEKRGLTLVFRIVITSDMRILIFHLRLKLYLIVSREKIHFIRIKNCFCFWFKIIIIVIAFVFV